ncbi:FAD-dependent monooxygenase [Actinomadura xylanilytica]|uniref:FAD-dependent monooxygenase n=1 Tax=Actinomadura xylanilytica TaxID=887459 RepID=UPI00255A8CB3|nr:FAD-dependent monooxygenase [Actinomadura xylanilytica]MDL4773864.1 FAD-dependent monooxygenase [Actinomadura xylanilytica]
MNPTRKHVLISGASIAGPALALCLNRHGFATTIVEKSPALRTGGYAVDFRGKAHLDVLRRMGVLGEIERARTRMGAMAMVNSAGKKLVSMPEDLFAGDVEILRGDLARILVDATRERTEYVFGDSITGLADGADGVDVTFERAAPRRFDLVVGADGFHSNVRSIAFGPERDHATHLGLYNAIFTTANHLGLDRTGLGYSTPGKTVTMYSARDNTEAKAVFYFASALLDLDRHDTAGQQKALAERFRGGGWETDRLLDAMADAPDFYFDSVGQIRMDAWTRGRIALLGDAACCPSSLSGMGTGLAVVGAYALAGELAAAGGDHRTAFARYEALVRPYAEGCQKSGEGVSRFMVPETRFMAWFLNQNFRLLPYLPWKGMMARSARRTAEAISVPAYDL